MKFEDWGPFFIDQEPITIILKIAYDKLSDKFIPNNRIYYDQGSWKDCIPFVEAWYPDKIPLSFIESTYYTYFDSDGYFSYRKIKISDMNELAIEFKILLCLNSEKE